MSIPSRYGNTNVNSEIVRTPILLPLDYDSEFHISYTDRSLVDKEYVDNLISTGAGIYGGSGSLPSNININTNSFDIQMTGVGGFYTTNPSASWSIGQGVSSQFQMYQVVTTHDVGHYIIQQKTDVSSTVIAQRILSNSEKTGTGTIYGINNSIAGIHEAGTNVGIQVNVENALNNYGMTIQNGSVGIGNTEPTETLHIENTGTNNGGIDARIKYVDGNEQLGYVLTSDADGVATWQTPTTGSGLWTDVGAETYLTSLTDEVGIGLIAPTAKLHVVGSGGDGDDVIKLFSTTAMKMQMDLTGKTVWSDGLAASYTPQSRSVMTITPDSTVARAHLMLTPLTSAEAGLITAADGMVVFILDAAASGDFALGRGIYAYIDKQWIPLF